VRHRHVLRKHHDNPSEFVPFAISLGASGDGSVILQATTNANGKVENVDVVSGVSPLSEITVSAVRDWKFHVPSSREPADISIVVAVYRSPKFNH